jgi:hypothetical protein
MIKNGGKEMPFVIEYAKVWLTVKSNFPSSVNLRPGLGCFGLFSQAYRQPSLSVHLGLRWPSKANIVGHLGG